MKISLLLLSALLVQTRAFTPISNNARSSQSSVHVTTEESETTTVDVDEERQLAKAKLFGLIGASTITSSSTSSPAYYVDPVLADPITKEPLKISVSGTILGGQGSKNTGMKVVLSSEEDEYVGRTNTYYNLLRQTSSSDDNDDDGNDGDGNGNGNGIDDESSNALKKSAMSTLSVFIPPPLRSVLNVVLPDGEKYIPMRDLFTSPSVSFAYERGWRQGFASAGFPGADKEYELVREYFMPINPEVVVDMSCATGLFTRRLTKGNDYSRVIGCDYSEAMLLEARNRISTDPELSTNKSSKTNLDLVRCDVGEIPMKSDSIDALHAGAAMHCWPDLDSAFTEIYRVLRPGGRFFASTFLAPYFRNVQAVGGDGVESQAFQYFESVEALKDIVMKGGFEESDIEIEVLGTACVIIRAEKSNSLE